jgi:hypothetical protein
MRTSGIGSIRWDKNLDVYGSDPDWGSDLVIKGPNPDAWGQDGPDPDGSQPDLSQILVFYCKMTMVFCTVIALQTKSSTNQH